MIPDWVEADLNRGVAGCHLESNGFASSDCVP
ncbi:hypothetical protein DHODJN_25615 [Methylorubrum extorquens]